ASLVKDKDISNPEEFIKALPHISFVHGHENVAFLEKRFKAMSEHPLFKEMMFSNDVETIKEWIPLMMEGRHAGAPVAATKISSGTDVNFGEVTRKMIHALENQKNIDIHYNHQVDDIKRMVNGKWEVK